MHAAANQNTEWFVLEGLQKDPTTGIIDNDLNFDMDENFPDPWDKDKVVT